jgi:hypothetical protein
MTMFPLGQRFVVGLLLFPASLSMVDAVSFVGLWEGVDPLDGANMQRSFVPMIGSVDGYDYEIAGRIEQSQICGGDISGNITEEPDVTDKLIPAVLNGYGTIVNGTVVTASLAITCFGEEEPRIPDIPVEYKFYDYDDGADDDVDGGTTSTKNTPILMEIPAFRADSPIYFFLVSNAMDEDNSGSGGSIHYGTRAKPNLIVSMAILMFFGMF